MGFVKLKGLARVASQIPNSGYRHIGGDRLIFALFELVTFVVSGIGHRRQRVYRQGGLAWVAMGESCWESLPSLVAALATMSLCLASTAICTL